MNHIRQPDNSPTCGHACLAMILGITFEEACDLVGWRNRGVKLMTMVQLINTSGRIICSREWCSWKAWHIGRPAGSSFSLVQISAEERGERKIHAVVFKNDLWYDPNVDEPRSLDHGPRTFTEYTKDIVAVELWDFHRCLRELNHTRDRLGLMDILGRCVEKREEVADAVT